MIKLEWKFLIRLLQYEKVVVPLWKGFTVHSYNNYDINQSDKNDNDNGMSDILHDLGHANVDYVDQFVA